MNSITEVTNFMYENLNGFLATVDSENKPHVRAMQFMMEEDGRYYFATSINKNVFNHLIDNPYAEYAVTTPNFSKYIRMSGKVTFTKNRDLSDRLLEAHDFLKAIYKTPDNPEFQVFYFEHGLVLYWDFEGNETAIEF